MKPESINLIYELARTPHAMAIIEGEFINSYQAALIYSAVESIQKSNLRRAVLRLPIKHLMELATMIGERQIEDARKRKDESSLRFLDSMSQLEKNSIKI